MEIEKLVVFDPSPLSYAQSLELVKESIWRKLEQITVERALSLWLETVQNPRTRKAYRLSFQEFFRLKILSKEANLQEFSLCNANALIDQIKTLPLFTAPFPPKLWSEATRQQRAAAFLSFTAFLHRRTQGLILKAIPSKEGHTRTFYPIHHRIKTPAFTERSEWTRFIEELSKINPRDALIAKIMLQGGKRISEVLGLQADRIDFAKGEVTFRQSKTKGTQQITIITFRQEIMQELQTYLQGRTGYVFITRTGASLSPQQIERNFKKAGIRASIAFPVTPHVLRATTVTYLKKSGFADSDIMKITGHASSEMIRMYDKSSLADNASKKINLV